MVVRTAVEGLGERLRGLHDALRELQVAVLDHPPDGDARLLDSFTEAATEMLDWVEEGLSAVAATTPAAGPSLGVCHERLNQLSERFGSVTGYTPVAELTRFARERGGEWRDWARSVRINMERIRSPLREAADALVGCWRDAADRVSVGVSVQTTAIGQVTQADIDDGGRFPRR